MKSDISATIEQYIVTEILMKDPNTNIDPDSSLITSGVVDSLSLLRLINFLEEEFGIVVEDEEVVPDNFDSLNIMDAYVKGKLA